MSERLVQEVLAQPQSAKFDDTADTRSDPAAAPDVTTFEASKGLTAKFGDSITVDKLNDFAKKAVEVVEGLTGLQLKNSGALLVCLFGLKRTGLKS
jgi:hypothetical protein